MIFLLYMVEIKKQIDSNHYGIFSKGTNNKKYKVVIYNNKN